MNVSQELTGILNQIQRNQQQIDLLSSNNSQLVNFLIQTGMVQSLREIPGFQFDPATGLAAPGQRALPAPTTAPKNVRKARKWSTAQRAHFSKLMKDRWKKWGGLKQPPKAKAAKA